MKTDKVGKKRKAVKLEPQKNKFTQIYTHIHQISRNTK